MSCDHLPCFLLDHFCGHILQFNNLNSLCVLSIPLLACNFFTTIVILFYFQRLFTLSFSLLIQICIFFPVAVIFKSLFYSLNLFHIHLSICHLPGQKKKNPWLKALSLTLQTIILLVSLLVVCVGNCMCVLWFLTMTCVLWNISSGRSLRTNMKFHSPVLTLSLLSRSSAIILPTGPHSRILLVVSTDCTDSLYP